MAELSTNTTAICMLFERRLQERASEFDRRCRDELDDFARPLDQLVEHSVHLAAKARQGLEALVDSDQPEEDRSE